ncbi:hypothetical protein CAPTEDRAFT_225726 [Capitella teleta]|uniref:Uncharacterized protein n=1 Tax=Capitella teleta TaxID=283909 RepID=R7UYC7_CAPTE|nr:hypothetical protein CAPTEDRAFT_225726 [Capitella teleta]|eukprot:ELU08947.1 hypothetical protein CAPTEDRAFT_225726 [Capitella teleta]
MEGFTFWLSPHGAPPPPPPPKEVCPSFCDYDGTWIPNRACGPKHFCCLLSDSFLGCCADPELKLPEDIGNDYNCYDEDDSWLTRHWEIILGLCLTLALISVMGTLGESSFSDGSSISSFPVIPDGIDPRDVFALGPQQGPHPPPYSTDKPPAYSDVFPADPI